MNTGKSACLCHTRYHRVHSSHIQSYNRTKYRCTQRHLNHLKAGTAKYGHTGHTRASYLILRVAACLEQSLRSSSSSSRFHPLSFAQPRSAMMDNHNRPNRISQGTVRTVWYEYKVHHSVGHSLAFNTRSYTFQSTGLHRTSPPPPHLYQKRYT
jgi:hypothetical protein